MTGTDQEQLIRDLRDPAACPAPENEIRFVATHISLLLIGRERVLKLKRPVRFSFVDYSTREKRYQACLDEVRLNRLLADDIYLGVVPIVREGGRYRIGTGDQRSDAVEWATLMRRIDDDEMLDGLLERGVVPDSLADRLADRLVPFHQQQPAVGMDDPERTLDIILAVLRENLEEVAAFSGDPLPAHELATIIRVVRSFVDGHRQQLRTRVTEGWVREGHGDLRCEHVIVPEQGPVQVYDCVEFNVDLRIADIASDIAFLLMDLFRLDAPEGVISRLLERYRDAGVDLPVSLLRAYWIHRALVRAKIHCLRLADLAGNERLAVARKAVDYVHVAFSQAIETVPAVIAMTGLSGTGKSTLARDLARATGAVFLDTDVIRKDAAYLAGDLDASRGKDIYTPAWTQRTYDRMIGEGSEVVRQGGIAILDGTFLDRALRDQAAEAARDLEVPFVMVEVQCDEDVVFRRLDARVRDPRRTSDAGIQIHLRQRERMRTDPPGLPDGTLHVVVDTTPDGPVSLDPVIERLIVAGIIVPGIRGTGSLP